MIIRKAREFYVCLLRSRALTGRLTAISATFAIACGGSDEQKVETERGGNVQADIDLGSDYDSGIVDSFGPRRGGRADLSAEQIKAIGEAACTGWNGEGENLPAVLQLVVDVSLSMSFDAPGTSQSRWDVTQSALQQAIDGLPPAVAVGMLLYPNLTLAQESANQCVDFEKLIPVDLLANPGSNHRVTLRDALEGAIIDSYTPTHDAYRHALVDGLIPYQSSARKFMLLITDGAPTRALSCAGGPGANDQPTQPIIDEIESALSEHGIRSFLIGVPGSEESAQAGGGGDMRPWLSRAAMVGDTAISGCTVDGPNFCHLDMTQSTDLAQSLSEGLAAIAGQIVDECTFSVPQAPDGEAIDPRRTNLIIHWGDGSASLILPDDDSAGCDDGWYFNEAAQVVLCGGTCDQVKHNDQTRVDLTFGCSVEDLPVMIR